MKRSDGIYITAFETWCDFGSYAAVAKQMGVSATTAKRWVRIGAAAWKIRNTA